MNTFNAADLPENKFFEEDAFIDNKFIVCAAGIPIAQALKKQLAEWDFDQVFSEGRILENSPFFDAVERKSSISALVSDELDALLEDAGLGDPSSAKERARKKQEALAVHDEELDAVKKEYAVYFEYTKRLYDQYSKTKTLDPSEINDKMKEFCVFMANKRRYILRLQATETSEYGSDIYLAKHALRSTVFATAIAIQLNFPTHRIIDVAVSCLLHEIGMARLPKTFFSSSASLSQQEKKIISAHPVISYNILREVSFPLNICLAALEHHEREDGSGYPRNLDRDHISIYAKIIAVACSYEAATSKRPYKAEELDAHSGIIDIMRNSGRQYDPKIIHALLLSLSLYPIGIYVLLSDGRRGQVTDINPEDPKHPIVQIWGEYRPDGTPKTVVTGESTVHIERPLTKEEGKAFRD